MNVSDWKPGSKWEHRRNDINGPIDLAGKVVEFLPPKRLVITWAFPEDIANEEKHTRFTLEIEPFLGVTRLILEHNLLESDSDMLQEITEGWPKVISSLKSLLETGHALPQLW